MASPERTPRVRDLTVRERPVAVEVRASALHETLAALSAVTGLEHRETLEAGRDWLAAVEAAMSPRLRTMLNRLPQGGSRVWFLLLPLAGAAEDAATLAGVIAATDPVDVYAAAVGGGETGGQVAPPDVVRAAAAGDAAAREAVRSGLRECFDDPEGLHGYVDMDPVRLRELLAGALRRFAHECGPVAVDPVMPALRAEATHLRRLARTLDTPRLVERATRGVRYDPEPGIRRILLVPHAAMRPWVLINQSGDTKVLGCPIGDDALRADDDEPPDRLVALCRALGDRQRLRILRRLRESPMSLLQVVEATGLSRSTAHHHLVVLRAAGLVTVDLRGEREYSFRADHAVDVNALLDLYLGAPARAGRRRSSAA